jgi:hypothetical protein
MSKDNMAAKTHESSPGRHSTSATFGTVYSDHETDKAGNGPEDFARMFERRMGRESSEQEQQPQQQQQQAEPAGPKQARQVERKPDSSESSTQARQAEPKRAARPQSGGSKQ